jgi:hypothetical protein
MKKRKDDTAAETELLPETLEDWPGPEPAMPAGAGVESLEVSIPAGRVITGVRVRAVGRHEHNGILYPEGAEITMSPEAAELAEKRGDIEIAGLNEEQQQ